MVKLTNPTTGEPKWGLVGGLTGIVVFLVIIAIFFISEFYAIVPPSHKGLVVSGGELQKEVLDDGFYTKTPFWTDIVPVFVGTNTTDDGGNLSAFRGIRPLSKDGQIMDLDVQINYAVTDPFLFRDETGSSNPEAIETLLFVPTVRRLVYDYVSEYTWKNLIQGGDRQELGQRIFNSMSTGEVTRRTCEDEHTKMDENTGTEVIVEAGCHITKSEDISKPEDFGIVITAINLRKVAPNEQIIAAVEEAQKKEQEVKVAEQEAEIAKQLANKAIEEKRGITESRKLEVAAEAYTKQVELEAVGEGLKAEAEGKRALAVAERELAAALAQSSGLIEYKLVDVKMKMAEAQLEMAKHYKGEVPNQVTIIGDKAAENNQMIYGLPNVLIGTQ